MQPGGTKKCSVISIKRRQRHELLTVLPQPFIIPGAIISEKLHFILWLIPCWQPQQSWSDSWCLQQALIKAMMLFIHSKLSVFFFYSVSLCLSHSQDLDTDQRWSGCFCACCCVQLCRRVTAAPAAASASTSPPLWLCSVLRPACCSCPPPSTARPWSCGSRTTSSPSSAGKTSSTWLVWSTSPCRATPSARSPPTPFWACDPCGRSTWTGTASVR